MNELSEVNSYADRLREWCIELLKRMISVPTVNPPGSNYKEFVDYVKGVLNDIGVETTIYKVPREYVKKVYPEYADYERYIVLARIGSGKPVLHFNSHYDVVPPGHGWNVDPFKPVIRDNRLYGRGAVDAKGGIASIILAVNILTKLESRLQGSVEVALVPDEEIGGKTGTGYLIETRIANPDYVVIAEPTGLNTVWIGHKGAIWGYIEVHGKQAHGSTPWLGINAFEYMVYIANKILEIYKPILNKRRSSYDYGDPEAVKPTINLGGEVKGGAKINQVPAYYAFSFDRRLIVEENLDDVEEELRRLVNELQKEYPEVTIRLKIVSKLPAVVTSPNTRLVRSTIKAIKEIAGVEARPTVCVGGLDLHYYVTNNPKIQAISYGPGPMDQAHRADEYVNISDVINVAKVYVRLALDLLR